MLQVAQLNDNATLAIGVPSDPRLLFPTNHPAASVLEATIATMERANPALESHQAMVFLQLPVL